MNERPDEGWRLTVKSLFNYSNKLRKHSLIRRLVLLHLNSWLSCTFRHFTVELILFNYRKVQALAISLNSLDPQVGVCVANVFQQSLREKRLKEWLRREVSESLTSFSSHTHGFTWWQAVKKEDGNKSNRNQHWHFKFRKKESFYSPTSCCKYLNKSYAISWVLGVCFELKLTQCTPSL